ncbi:thymidylate synthase [Spiroplasma endosymbiont of 'Nebria riversi']|uniref:thymidylate synthase n=1 Tax=Spiroplasma endosymbiont of 'Nebria riversi' TaxID=2792084 RepID=UPI001C05E553|nr:thymidylate synthase [Spiroplasma endosymbiont of 'Nebria riversi']
MEQYLSLCRQILEKGQNKPNRTLIDTISFFGYQMRFDLQKGFPPLTTKKVYLKAVIYELLWFIKGDTNIRTLVQNNVNIWNEWPYKKYQNSPDFKGGQLQDFISKIKNDEQFAKKYGDLGPVYGKQWRNFNAMDQLKNLEKQLKDNPHSRRHLLSSWNLCIKIEEMALPPCHTLFQFYVSADNKLSCQLYQRSADVFLGVHFNTASYALLTYMLASVCGYEVGDFVHTISDVHIYTNHLEQINEQLTRPPKKLGKLIINRSVTSIFNFKYEDFSLLYYESHPAAKGQAAV